MESFEMVRDTQLSGDIRHNGWNRSAAVDSLAY